MEVRQAFTKTTTRLKKCPVCELQDTPSVLIEGPQTTTLMSFGRFSDEEGNSHEHDGNRLTIDYDCSKGHHTTMVTGYGCDCGWKSNYLENEHLY